MHTTAVQTDITGDVAVPSGNVGTSVPEGTKRIEFLARLASQAPTPVVPVTYWGRHRASQAWIPIPGAAHADIQGLDNSAWLTSIDITCLDRVAVVVSGSSGTFSLDTYATFVD